MSNPESQLSRSLRESRKVKEKPSTGTDPAPKRALPSSSFARVPQVDTLGPLPEADEYENDDYDDFVKLYDTSKGLADGYKEDDAPRFFGEGSVFAFSRNLKTGGPLGDYHPRRRPEFWTTPSVRFPALDFRSPLGPRHLPNSITVDFPHPEGTSGFFRVPGAKFDAAPPGHLL